MSSRRNLPDSSTAQSDLASAGRDRIGASRFAPGSRRTCAYPIDREGRSTPIPSNGELVREASLPAPASAVVSVELARSRWLKVGADCCPLTASQEFPLVLGLRLAAATAVGSRVGRAGAAMLEERERRRRRRTPGAVGADGTSSGQVWGRVLRRDTGQVRLREWILSHFKAPHASWSPRWDRNLWVVARAFTARTVSKQRDRSGGGGRRRASGDPPRPARCKRV